MRKIAGLLALAAAFTLLGGVAPASAAAKSGTCVTSSGNYRTNVDVKYNVSAATGQIQVYEVTVRYGRKQLGIWSVYDWASSATIDDMRGSVIENSFGPWNPSSGTIVSLSWPYESAGATRSVVVSSSGSVGSCTAKIVL